MKKILITFLSIMHFIGLQGSFFARTKLFFNPLKQIVQQQSQKTFEKINNTVVDFIKKEEAKTAPYVAWSILGQGLIGAAWSGMFYYQHKKAEQTKFNNEHTTLCQTLKTFFPKKAGVTFKIVPNKELPQDYEIESPFLLHSHHIKMSEKFVEKCEKEKNFEQFEKEIASQHRLRLRGVIDIPLILFSSIICSLKIRTFKGALISHGLINGLWYIKNGALVQVCKKQTA